jgi:hypothetical protein
MAKFRRLLVVGGPGLARVQRRQKAASNDAGFCDDFTQRYVFSVFGRYFGALVVTEDERTNAGQSFFKEPVDDWAQGKGGG